MKKAAARKPAMSVAAMFAVGASVVVPFEMLNETPGASRLQEVDADATPLVNDVDGAKVGAMYLRKAAFGDMPSGAKFEVTVKRVA